MAVYCTCYRDLILLLLETPDAPTLMETTR